MASKRVAAIGKPRRVPLSVLMRLIVTREALRDNGVGYPYDHPED